MSGLGLSSRSRKWRQELENFTHFNDRNQSEMFKAMVVAAGEPKRYLTEG